MQGLDSLFLQLAEDLTQLPAVKNLVVVATILTPIVLFITLLIFNRQLRNQELELAVSNYNTVFQRFDHPISKAARRVIYRSHNHICSLEKNYGQKNTNEILDSVNEAAKYIAGIYDSIYFLVRDNPKLEQKLLEHHGLTMGRLWKVLQGLHQTWINEDFVGGYVGFRTLGSKSYTRNKEAVEQYLENNYKKAVQVKDEEILNLKKNLLEG